MVASQQNRKTGRAYNLVSASLAFLAWGGWTFYVNGGHGLRTQFTSSLAQGTASFIITLVMVRIVTWFYNHLPVIPLWKVILSAVFTVSITGSCLVIVHLTAGTPELFMTIAPPQVIAFLFCLVTAGKLTLNSNLAEDIS